jgi:hypothetical protein
MVEQPVLQSRRRMPNLIIRRNQCIEKKTAVVGNTVNIMESNTKRGMKLIAEIVGAAATSSKALTEGGTIKLVVVAGAINIMVV